MLPSDCHPQKGRFLINEVRHSMGWPTVPLVAVVALLASCVTPETQGKIDRKQADVDRLIPAVAEAEKSGSPELDALRVKLDKTLADLSKLNAKAREEKDASISEIANDVKKGTQAASSFAAYLFPPAVLGLALVGQIASIVSRKYKPKSKKGK